MSEYIFLFIIVLAMLAAILRSDFVLTLVYLLLGVYAAGRWWSRQAMESVSTHREFNDRVFLGEKVPVELEVENRSLLPVAWLQFHENLPFELVTEGFFRQVISLGPRAKMTFRYLLEGRRRGYYDIGPMTIYSGDLFGVTESVPMRLPENHLTVYPKIIPLTRVALPSRSPMGTLRHTQPIFEDPTRVVGKRDYVAGDSLRRIDWKATAASGRMQVKQFEPSIALETAIFLNLNSDEYDPRYRFGASELAVVVAASLASYVTGLRQAVGLVTNGVDPLQGESSPQPLLPRQGRGNLMRILDVLARIQTGVTTPMVDVLRRESVRLSWGTTLILITPLLDEAMFDALFSARRAGLNAILVPCGPVANFEDIRRRAGYFRFPLYQIMSESDLDIWRA